MRAPELPSNNPPLPSNRHWLPWAGVDGRQQFFSLFAVRDNLDGWSPCENEALIRTTVAVVSATFGTMWNHVPLCP